MSGTAPVDKTLGNNVRRKNIGTKRPVFYAQETYKNEDASLTCIISSRTYIVRKMYHSLFILTLLLPSLFHFLTLLAVVPVRVLFKPVPFQNRSHVLFYDMTVRIRGRNAREPP